MAQRLRLLYVVILLSAIVHTVIYCLSEPEISQITRDQALIIINGQEFACDSIVLISRLKSETKIGCDWNSKYLRYAIYKDDYGFNKVRME